MKTSSCAWAVGPQGFGRYRIELDQTGARFEPTDSEPEGIVTPGLVDLHFHGAFGIDFMSASPDQLTELGVRLEGLGYEAVLLTTVTAPFESIRRACAQIPERPIFAGIHLEGPFLSPDYPGAQPAEFLRMPPTGPSEWDEIFGHPALRVVTLAPELEGALELVPRIGRPGLTFSMGHTAATFLEAQAAVEAGFRRVTHCYNAMRGFHHREPGALGCAFVDPNLTPELIYDRVHVAKAAVDVLLMLKGADNVIAVSDSTMATGLPFGTRLEMWGHPVVVERDDVRLVDGGALAGSTITLRDAFKNLVADFGPETAIRLCCLNPRRTLGLDEPRIWVQWSLAGNPVAVVRVGAAEGNFGGEQSVPS
ncbi:MAG TPA: amidohydrolase family protein [Fimbriimonadaceae bacterium]|nr:amidohydrolase family protein [Fimbriimonadaceae bacterium]